MIGIQTIRQGQRVAVWDRAGRVHLVDGPRRLILYGQTVEPLDRFTADEDEYLIVRFRDGHTEHVPGPAEIWFDPIHHDEVEVAQAMAIDAHEAVVVYRREENVVARRVVRGPARFIPTENEWLHEFRWHGTVPGELHDTGTHLWRKAPRALEFQRLRVIPDQMYFDVEDVRTADDALLAVRLMIFFELADIERMLDQTHDPVADFINAVSADVIDFVGGLTFEAFKQQVEALSALATYGNLTSRAERIGYRINNVVYRGYLANPRLQAMHDNAIEARTQLRLQAETEEQAQALADLKLEREANRAAEARQMERDQAEHRQQLKQLGHEAELSRRRDLQAHHLEARRQRQGMAIEHLQAKHREEAAFLGGLQGMQVDLTRYLVAQYQNPDRLIRISGDGRSQLHLHDQT